MESKKEQAFDASMDYVFEKSTDLIQDFRRRMDTEPDADWSKRFDMK